LIESILTCRGAKTKLAALEAQHGPRLVQWRRRESRRVRRRTVLRVSKLTLPDRGAVFRCSAPAIYSSVSVRVMLPVFVPWGSTRIVY
jgi:hypothetical protein